MAEGLEMQTVVAEAFDAADIEIAVLDATGVITAVNPAWQRFSDANGGDSNRTGVGVNYLDVCTAAGHDVSAAAVAAAIQRALKGELTTADVVEIACHSPDQNRWFDVLVSARVAEGETVGATVVLTPVTKRTEARNAAAESAADSVSDQSPQDLRALSDVPEADGAVAWAMVEASPDALVMTDEFGVIELVNSQTEALFGYDRVELLGKPVDILLPERLAQVHAAHRTRFRVTPEVRTMGSGMDLLARRADGSEVSVEVSLSPLRVRGELRVIAAIRDVSDRVEADAQTRLVQSTIDAAHDGVFMFEADGAMRFTYVNRGAIEQTGYSRDELLAMTPLHIKPEFTFERFADTIAPLRDGTVERLEFETLHRRKDGRDVPVEIVLDYPPASVGGSRVMVALVRDITDRIAAEHQALIVQHSINSVSDAVFVCDEHTLEFVHVNQGAVDLHGFSRDELLSGMTPIDLAPDVDPEQLAALLEQLVSSPMEHAELHTKGRSKNGDILDVEVRINWPAPASATAPRPIVAVVRDIGARLETEARAREADARFRAAFDDGPVPMTIVEVSPSADRVIRQANQAMADLLGYPLDELVGMSVVDYTHPDDLAADDQATAEQLNGGQDEFTARKRLVRGDGSIVWVQIYVRVLRRDGDQVLTIGNSIDVTAEVEAEQADARQTVLNQTLSQVRLEMLRGASRGDALALICQGVQSTLNTTSVLLLTPTGVDTELGIEACVGVDDAQRRQLQFATDQGVAGDVYSTGVAAFTVPGDERILHANRVAAEEHKIESMLIAPLEGGSGIFGVLVASRGGQREPLNTHDLATVERFASAAVAAIEVAAVRDVEQQMEMFEDRERIARDMHDKVIGRLFASGMTMQATLARITDTAAKDRISTVVDEIDIAIKEIRTAVFGLRADRDWGRGIKGEILALAADQNEALGFEPIVSFTGPVDDLRFEIVEELLAILRESLTNTAKYAQASHVTLAVKADQRALHVTVQDDGVGFDTDADADADDFDSDATAEQHRGNGLANILARAEALGGTASITSSRDRGTTIDWIVPTV